MMNNKIVSHSFKKLYQKLVFHASSGYPNNLETITAVSLQPRAFICFSVSGYPNEALTLVFDTLLKLRLINK